MAAKFVVTLGRKTEEMRTCFIPLIDYGRIVSSLKFSEVIEKFFWVAEGSSQQEIEE